MEKLMLLVAFIGAQAMANTLDLRNVKCHDAVYSILHQGCVLPVNVQRTLLASETCATENDDQYYFQINGENVVYSIPSCGFKSAK